MSHPDVEISIDELLLDGPLGARAGAVREALGAHLARLVTERGLPGAGGGGGDHRIPRASFAVSPDLGADAIAQRVAEQIYARLVEERR
jgi:hypothetical protein